MEQDDERDDPTRTGDEQLRHSMRLYQAGDASAFDEIHQALAPRLRRYFRNRVGDDAHAEDLAQETFLQLHRAAPIYESSRPFMPWAFGVARHVYLMDRRARTSRQDLETSDEPLMFAPCPRCRPESLERKDLIRRATGALPAGRGRILVLHHVLGHSFKEISAFLGISETAAKVRAHRALRELRAVMRPAGGDSR